ncbi:NUDIX domain-containing protein [Novosphingobium sp. KCTC 2891]|uniref:NUDIX domain-containing protein n=1 Tax=Novosphingobium sp. KCTC 2891 TaxID=2989730 RepID=UPI002221A502|nr:NUDIX domain-containing protein [Novosphingobium sp. KCTC 2891]MCW1384025.1 NUDIX domain-containing protein [Novosphingobium sp. KCTC 2891]
MFGLVPAPLHRALLRAAHPVRLRVWGLLRLKVRGCSVLAFDPEGRILLVRHSYHRREAWMLPGGGIGRSKDPARSGARELREETGCRLEEATWFATFPFRAAGGWTNVTELVTGTTQDPPVADGRELEEAAFFPLDALPEGICGAPLHYLDLWRAWRADQNGNSA